MSTTLTIRVDPPVLEVIDRNAPDHDNNRSAFIRHALREFDKAQQIEAIINHQRELTEVLRLGERQREGIPHAVRGTIAERDELRAELDERQRRETHRDPLAVGLRKAQTLEDLKELKTYIVEPNR